MRRLTNLQNNLSISSWTSSSLWSTSSPRLFVTKQLFWTNSGIFHILLVLVLNLQYHRDTCIYIFPAESISFYVYISVSISFLLKEPYFKKTLTWCINDRTKNLSLAVVWHYNINVLEVTIFRINSKQFHSSVRKWMIILLANWNTDVLYPFGAVTVTLVWINAWELFI